MKNKTIKNTARYITTLILIGVLVLAGGLAAIFSLGQSGWKFGDDKKRNIAVENTALFSGTGHIYNLKYANKYAMSALGTATGEALGAFNYGVLAAPATNELHLTYTLLQGEVTRDAFISGVWGECLFYPPPDADLVGLEAAYVSDSETNFRFYGRLPGSTTFRMMSTGSAGNALKEVAITVTINVVTNPLFTGSSSNKKGTIATRTFVQGTTISLSNLLNNTSNHEILAVGKGDDARELQQNNSAISPLNVLTTGAIGARSGNTSFVFRTRPEYTYLPLRVAEVVVRDNSTGEIFFVPIVHHKNSNSTNNSLVMHKQAYGRTFQAVNNTVTLTQGSPASPAIFINILASSKMWLSSDHHNNPFSLMPQRQYNNVITSYPSVAYSGMPAFSTPVGYPIIGYIEEIPLHHSGMVFVVNDARWGTSAPKPKAYTGNIEGTGIGANNSADYPTVNLERRSPITLKAEDIATVPAGKNMEITKIYSYSAGLLNAAYIPTNKSVILSPGENPKTAGLYLNRSEMIVEVKNTTDNLVSYITIYFTVTEEGLEGEGIWQRNNLPIEAA